MTTATKLNTTKTPRTKAKRPRPVAAPRQTKGPYTLPCGCNATGFRCPIEQQLGERLDTALSAWKATQTRRNLTPAHPDFERAYWPLLTARRDYHAHFASQGAGGYYDPERDELLREHRRTLFGND